MPWSLGIAANPLAVPPVEAVQSDTERLRDLFDLRTSDLPFLRSAMSWLSDNNPEGITTVQINLDKADRNHATLEGIYSDEDYATKKLDVIEIEVSERSTGSEILRQRYKQKIWNALDLGSYFCEDLYLGTGNGNVTSGRS